MLGETGMRKRVDDIQHLMTYYVHHVIQFNYLLICGNIIGHIKFTSSLLRRKTEVNFLQTALDYYTYLPPLQESRRKRSGATL